MFFLLKNNGYRYYKNRKGSTFIVAYVLPFCLAGLLLNLSNPKNGF